MVIARAAGAVLAMAVVVLVGLFFRYPELGNISILAYGVLSFILRIPSGTTYMMAFILLLTIPFLSVLGQEDTMRFFIGYVFALLCTGFVMHIVEQTTKNSTR